MVARMKRFRLLRRHVAPAPQVVSAVVVELGSIRSLPDSIRERLGHPDTRACLATVDASHGPYSLVLDPDWVTFALELDEKPGDLIGDAMLPRSAIWAVIHGWEHDTDGDDATVRWSEDHIPHVGFPSHIAEVIG